MCDREHRRACDRFGERDRTRHTFIGACLVADRAVLVSHEAQHACLRLPVSELAPGCHRCDGGADGLRSLIRKAALARVTLENLCLRRERQGIAVIQCYFQMRSGLAVRANPCSFVGREPRVAQDARNVPRQRGVMHEPRVIGTMLLQRLEHLLVQGAGAR